MSNPIYFLGDFYLLTRKTTTLFSSFILFWFLFFFSSATKFNGNNVYFTEITTKSRLQCLNHFWFTYHNWAMKTWILHLNKPEISASIRDTQIWWTANRWERTHFRQVEDNLGSCFFCHWEYCFHIHNCFSTLIFNFYFFACIFTRF